MRQAIKNIGKFVEAYRLGDGSETECRLLREGKIRRTPDGAYELFSMEAVNGKGQPARKGDYFKLSSTGDPYPNDREFFEANHRSLGENRYEQIPVPRLAWILGDEISPEMHFLIEKKGLVIDPDQPERCFSAVIYGSPLSAASDAVLLIYSVTRDADGTITDIDFNFVAKQEFDSTYSWM